MDVQMGCGKGLVVVELNTARLTLDGLKKKCTHVADNLKR